MCRICELKTQLVAASSDVNAHSAMFDVHGRAGNWEEADKSQNAASESSRLFFTLKRELITVTDGMNKEDGFGHDGLEMAQFRAQFLGREEPMTELQTMEEMMKIMGFKKLTPKFDS